MGGNGKWGPKMGGFGTFLVGIRGQDVIFG